MLTWVTRKAYVDGSLESYYLSKLDTTDEEQDHLDFCSDVAGLLEDGYDVEVRVDFHERLP